MFRRSTCWLAGAAWLAAPRLAQAEPHPAARPFSASLEYVAPATCPRASDFTAIVVQRLGFDPFSENASRHVLVLISAGEHTLEGRIEWRDASGSWAGDQSFPVHHEDCAELARAMGFALAVQIHLLAAGEESARSATGTAATGASAGTAAAGAGAGSSESPSGASGAPRPVPPAQKSTPAGPSASQVNGEPRERWAFALGAGGGLGLGLSSTVTPLGRVFGGAARGFLSFELGAELGAKTSTERVDGAGFVQHLVLASGAGCGSAGAWSACVLAKGGVVKVSGRAVDVPESSSTAVFQAGLRLAARQRLGMVFFAERLEGLVNVTRWTVRLDQVPVWTAPPVAGTFGVDVGVLFD
ncbi:MAG TPA: hypothetical protein VGQ57_10300 [Polyangiaceae bacterium]|nr:hypothetical protein [Polyangiaceae bacterium]